MRDATAELKNRTAEVGSLRVQHQDLLAKISKLEVRLTIPLNVRSGIYLVVDLAALSDWAEDALLMRGDWTLPVRWNQFSS